MPAGLVQVRSQDLPWIECWHIECALAGLGTAGERWVPAWVPLLIGMVALGHLFSGLRDRRCGLLDLPPLIRAGAYVTAVLEEASGPVPVQFTLTLDAAGAWQIQEISVQRPADDPAQVVQTFLDLVAGPGAGKRPET